MADTYETLNNWEGISGFIKDQIIRENADDYILPIIKSAFSKPITPENEYKTLPLINFYRLRGYIDTCFSSKFLQEKFLVAEWKSTKIKYALLLFIKDEENFKIVFDACPAYITLEMIKKEQENYLNDYLSEKTWIWSFLVNQKSEFSGVCGLSNKTAGLNLIDCMFVANLLTTEEKIKCTSLYPIYLIGKLNNTFDTYFRNKLLSIVNNNCIAFGVNPHLVKYFPKNPEYIVKILRDLNPGSNMVMLK